MECNSCSKPFELNSIQRTFLDRQILPYPVQCSDCRLQKRLMFRNERALFRRSCSYSGKNILSIYPQETKFPVYDHQIWWGDEWSGLDYGRPFDFSRTFFDQFAELFNAVPRRNLIFFNNENSDYTNMCSYLKDCYLLFASDSCRACYNSSYLQGCEDCVDCLLGSNSQLCINCVDMHGCYACVHSRHIRNCHDCIFCSDCIGSSDCIFSAGLRNCRFHIFNREVSESEFRSFKKELALNSFHSTTDAMKRWQEFSLAQPAPALHTYSNEDCRGDFLYNSKNCVECFNVIESNSCAFLYDAIQCVDCVDCNEIGGSELCVEVLEGFSRTYASRYSMYTAESSFLEYCDKCHSASSLFGCIGLRRQSYCILNKQYSQAEYARLKAKIVEHMKTTGEYGLFFPGSLSPFAYNESTAHDLFPLTEAECMTRGYRCAALMTIERTNGQFELPDNVHDFRENMSEELCSCGTCGNYFKIPSFEFNLYRNSNLALPRDCFQCRSKKRMKTLPSRSFHTEPCKLCNTEVVTTVPTEWKQNIVCEQCFL